MMLERNHARIPVMHAWSPLRICCFAVTAMFLTGCAAPRQREFVRPSAGGQFVATVSFAMVNGGSAPAPTVKINWNETLDAAIIKKHITVLVLQRYEQYSDLSSLGLHAVTQPNPYWVITHEGFDHTNRDRTLTYKLNIRLRLEGEFGHQWDEVYTSEPKTVPISSVAENLTFEFELCPECE